ncbi:hypothetical protein CF328_g7405 [Tilletia controversa]|nr:hypothetical protein CF328_g7405 [Tilletia controversa]
MVSAPNPAGRLAPQQQHNQQPQQHQQHQRPPNDNYSDQQEQSRLVDALRVQQQQPLPQQQPEELMSREYLARLLHEQRSELEALRRQRDADDARTAPQTGPTPDKHPSATAPPRRTKPRQPPAAAGGAAIGLPSTSAGSAFGQPPSSSASSGPTVGNGSIPGAAPARRPTVGNGSITGAAPARGPSSSGPETETATAAIAAVTPTVDADSDPPPPQSLSAVMRDINAAHAPHTETDPTLRALWIQDLIVHQIGLMAKDFGMPEAQCRRMVVPGSGCIDIRKPNDANLWSEWRAAHKQHPARKPDQTETEYQRECYAPWNAMDPKKGKDEEDQKARFAAKQIVLGKMRTWREEQSRRIDQAQGSAKMAQLGQKINNLVNVAHELHGVGIVVFAAHPHYRVDPYFAGVTHCRQLFDQAVSSIRDGRYNMDAIAHTFWHHLVLSPPPAATRPGDRTVTMISPWRFLSTINLDVLNDKTWAIVHGCLYAHLFRLADDAIYDLGRKTQLTKTQHDAVETWVVRSCKQTKLPLRNLFTLLQNIGLELRGWPADAKNMLASEVKADVHNGGSLTIKSGTLKYFNGWIPRQPARDLLRALRDDNKLLRVMPISAPHHLDDGYETSTPATTIAPKKKKKESKQRAVSDSQRQLAVSIPIQPPAARRPRLLGPSASGEGDVDGGAPDPSDSDSSSFSSGKDSDLGEEEEEPSRSARKRKYDHRRNSTQLTGKSGNRTSRRRPSSVHDTQTSSEESSRPSSRRQPKDAQQPPKRARHRRTEDEEDAELEAVFNDEEPLTFRRKKKSSSTSKKRFNGTTSRSNNDSDAGSSGADAPLSEGERQRRAVQADLIRSRRRKTAVSVVQDPLAQNDEADSVGLMGRNADAEVQGLFPGLNERDTALSTLLDATMDLSGIS